MCILPAQQPHASAARLLSAQARQQLALDALAGVSVTQLAAQNQVSRKFVYQQLDKAHQGLQLAFDPPPPPEGLLFWLPVTRSWLQQLVLGLALVCHSSFRCVGECHRPTGPAAQKAGPLREPQGAEGSQAGQPDHRSQQRSPTSRRPGR